MNNRPFIFQLGVVLILLLIYQAYAYDLPKLFHFNRHDALQEWQEKIFKNKVIYEVEPLRESGYLAAKSQAACSGLIYRVKFDPQRLPMISWQWRVSKFPASRPGKESSAGWIERDDYAARVYVIFAGWNFMNIKSLEYVWDESLPLGTILECPRYRNLKLIVAESGKANHGQWVFEERDIGADYQRAFGRAPNRSVTAIALMTDSDNTTSTAEAFYRNIKVGYRK